MLRRPGSFVPAGLFLALLSSTALGDDWPQWRYDASRSARSPQGLAPQLHLQWTRELPPLYPPWPEQSRLQFDTTYEPVVAGQTMFVGSSRRDGVTAYDTRTGAERWRFFAGGPVRFAPLVWEGRVYVVSDDGFLTCLDASTGAVHWKFRGGPSDRRVLGNGRLVSTWPARGAPAIADGTVYFTAGIWPFMGIFLHALDARTGKVVWTNEGDGSIYMQQPHNTDSFAGVAPQGYLVVSGDRVLVPGGRSIPACYDRKTGKLAYFKLAENARRGGYDVAASATQFYNGGFAFELATGAYLGELGRNLVLLEDGFAYSGRSKGIVRIPAPEVKITEVVDKAGKKIQRKSWIPASQKTFDLPPVECLIQAGARFYAGVESRVVAVDPGSGAVTWEAPVEGTPDVLVAADDRLFVVTREGRIACFGADKVEPAAHRLDVAELPAAPEWSSRAEAILKDAGVPEGWAVAWGWGTGGLVAELVRRTPLSIAVVEPDPARAEAARAALSAGGVLGDRVEVVQAEFDRVELPPYFASLMVAEQLAAPGPELSAKIFRSLRPYGGRAALPARLEGAREGADGLFVLSRPDAIPGAANWTHEHADAANTRVSLDSAVTAPLGLLWWGGSTHEGVLPRHGHGPQPQVLDGRLFIEGVDFLRAMDIYTGRVLWEADLPGLGRLYNNTSHQPGANSSGTNFISTPEGIYVAYGSTCVVLDPATGRRTAEIRPPLPEGAKQPPLIGTLSVAGDALVLALDPLGAERPFPKADPRVGNDDPFASPEALLTKLLSVKIESDTFSSSKRLAVLDRKTGRPLWTAAARDGWRHNSLCVGNGRLFAIDRLSGAQLAKLKKPGEKELPKLPSKLVSFDLRTGRIVWESESDIFGTWLSVSEEHDVLMEAGRVARDTINDEPKGVRAWKASTGGVIWEKKDLLGPAMIQGRTVLLTGRACDLLTGEIKVRQHPVTGLPVEWTWNRNYGCNTPMASTHLLTFRSGAAGYFDLARDGGTGNFGGFRSSCTNNLVVAGGVLTAPEYTRTCTCGYQNQSSIGLVPMPEAEMWTFWGVSDLKGPARRVGINLGAPGDRKSDDGVYWMEFPNVGGKSPLPSVNVSADKGEWFRLHASRIEGPLPWVAASGVKGVKSVTVTLDKEAKEDGEVDVRLVFAEPDEVGPGARVFDVSIQGLVVLKDFDVAAEAGGPRRSIVREFKGVKAGKELKVSFTPIKKSLPLLCGLEVRGAWPEPEVVKTVPVERVARVDDEPLLLPASAGPAEEVDWNIDPQPYYWVAGIAGVFLVILLAIRARTHKEPA
jgi:outer membrane protein assembly factor BamB